MNTPIKIVVGSKNPVKINAALAGFETMFAGQAYVAEGFDVDSNVSDQPMSCDETRLGATNRAAALRTLAPDAGYFVGIEGGIERIGETLFASAWIVIIDDSGNFGSARSGSFALPPQVQQLVDAGRELGHANDVVFKEHNSKQQGGAVGSLTGGIVSRQSLYEHAMALALVPFKNTDLFFQADLELP
jgi:inosine/xanthosine triphosphatase